MSMRDALRQNSLHERLTLLDILDQQTGVTESDPQGRITWVNRRFEQISGYCSDELLGRDHRLLHSGMHDAAFWKDVWAVIGTGAPWQGELCNRAKDGHLFWEDTVIAPLPGLDGRTAKYIAVRRDISAAKLAEAELQAGRLALARTKRLAGVGGWTLHPGRQLLQLSDESRRILGLAPGQDLDLSQAVGHLRNENLRSLRAAIHDAAALGRPFDCLLQLRSTGLQQRWVRVIGEIDASHGQLPLVVGALQDVTALTLAQRSAEASERTLRSAIEALDAPFALFDADERLLFCNERYRDLVGDRHGSVEQGMSYEEVLRLGMRNGKALPATPDIESWVLQQIENFRSQHSDNQNALQDGRWIRAINRITADGLHVVFRIDVTESRRYIEAAGAAARSKSQFLANMSHEIRTPLNAVLGMLQLLGHTQMDAEQADLVGKADGAARHLLGLLNNILDHSKAEAGKMTLDPQPFELPRLLDDLRLMLSANLGDKPLQLRIDADPRLPDWLLGDALRLQQVLINLGGNAIKFTERGHVCLQLRLAQEQARHLAVRFEISDTGIGIAPDQQRHIFAGFTQAEASTSRRYGGTGLGLSISQRLVQLMGGELQLHSEPGRGSRFFFTLPLPRTQPPAPVALPLASTGPRLAGLRLLLAEDNALNREVALKLLGREGARVDCAEDGLQALAALAAADYDLVLMDMQMPRLDGLQATRQLRREPRWAMLPVLAMTANASPADRAASLAAGMDGHVGKPFDLDDLVDAILNLCRRTPTPRGFRTGAPAPDESQVLDDAGALARLGHDRLFYGGLLHEFVPLAERLADAILARGDRDAAHQLRGNAAAVGAHRLAALCAAIEAGKGNHERLRPELDDLLQAIQRWLLTFDSPSADGGDLALALDALADSLQRRALDCFDRYDALIATHGPRLGEALLPLRQAMESFDTEAAVTACRALRLDPGQTSTRFAH